MAKAKATPKGDPSTSFIVRSITHTDRLLLNAYKHATSNATDSGAIGHAVRMAAREREARVDAERDRDAMEAKAAALVDALQQRAAADKATAKALKELADVKNAAFIRSMHTN